jgi:hypothetical protein
MAPRVPQTMAATAITMGTQSVRRPASLVSSMREPPSSPCAPDLGSFRFYVVPFAGARGGAVRATCPVALFDGVDESILSFFVQFPTDREAWTRVSFDSTVADRLPPGPTVRVRTWACPELPIAHTQLPDRGARLEGMGPHARPDLTGRVG